MRSSQNIVLTAKKFGMVREDARPMGISGSMSQRSLMVCGYECRHHGGEESISLLYLQRKRGRASDPEDNS
jgi:hypothetical protein